MVCASLCGDAERIVDVDAFLYITYTGFLFHILSSRHKNACTIGAIFIYDMDDLIPLA
jgi:hypothetical protein